jgi:hypothetical protein
MPNLSTVLTPNEDAIFLAIFSWFQVEVNACEFVVFYVFSVSRLSVVHAVRYSFGSRRSIVARGGPQSVFLFLAGVVLGEEGHATFGTNGLSVRVLKAPIQVIIHTMHSTRRQPAHRAIWRYTVHIFRT